MDWRGYSGEFEIMLHYMDMVGHNHKRIDFQFRPDVGRPFPFLLHDFPHLIQNHATIHDPPKMHWVGQVTRMLVTPWLRMTTARKRIERMFLCP